MKERGIIIDDFHGYNGDKRTIINNCVDFEAGLSIFNNAFNTKQQTLHTTKDEECEE